MKTKTAPPPQIILTIELPPLIHENIATEMTTKFGITVTSRWKEGTREFDFLIPGDAAARLGQKRLAQMIGFVEGFAAALAALFSSAADRERRMKAGEI